MGDVLIGSPLIMRSAQGAKILSCIGSAKRSRDNMIYFQTSSCFTTDAILTHIAALMMGLSRNDQICPISSKREIPSMLMYLNTLRFSEFPFFDFEQISHFATVPSDHSQRFELWQI